MTPEEREKKIDDCVTMEASLNGILPIEVDRNEFEGMPDDVLEYEWNWLYDLCYLK